jgi:hypothetical protein
MDELSAIPQALRELALQLSRCTQMPECRSLGINDFPVFDCKFTALKYRNVALKSRTKFG